MTKANSTLIVTVLDRSGSMNVIREDMQGGFDSLIANQRKEPGECLVSLYQFDDKFETAYTSRPIAEVPPLELAPRGSTALWDALGRSITSTGEALARLPEHERPGKVLFILITDGMENASQEFTSQQITGMIKLQEQKYAWQFIYLGSTPSTHMDAAKVGISTSAQFSANRAGVVETYSVVGQAVSSYRSNKSTSGTMDWAAHIPSKIPETPPAK